MLAPVYTNQIRLNVENLLEEIDNKSREIDQFQLKTDTACAKDYSSFCMIL